MEEENPNFFLIISICSEREEDLLRVKDTVVLNPEENLRIISLRK
jgi:hypothetical protein